MVRKSLQPNDVRRLNQYCCKCVASTSDIRVGRFARRLGPILLSLLVFSFVKPRIGISKIGKVNLKLNCDFRDLSIICACDMLCTQLARRRNLQFNRAARSGAGIRCRAWSGQRWPGRFPDFTPRPQKAGTSHFARQGWSPPPGKIHKSGRRTADSVRKIATMDVHPNSRSSQ